MKKVITISAIVMFAFSSLATQANVFEGFKSGVSDAARWAKKHPEIVAPLAASAAVGLAGGAAYKWQKGRPAEQELEVVAVEQQAQIPRKSSVSFPQGSVGLYGTEVYQREASPEIAESIKSLEGLMQQGLGDERLYSKAGRPMEDHRARWGSDPR